MKIKFIINFPELGFRKKPKCRQEKPVSQRTSFRERAGAYGDVIGLLFVAGLALAIGSRLDISATEVVILGYFFLALIRKFDSRFSAGLALALLVLIPVFLYADNEEIAETLAVYTFYFLCITVVQETRELWRVALSEKARSRGQKNRINFSAVWQRAGAFGAALEADFFDLAESVGQYWIFFCLLMSVYAIMTFFLDFEVSRKVFFALAVFSAVSTLVRFWKGRKRGASVSRRFVL